MDDLEELLERELNESEEDSALGPGTSASSPPQPIKPKTVSTHARSHGQVRKCWMWGPYQGEGGGSVLKETNI